MTIVTLSLPSLGEMRIETLLSLVPCVLATQDVQFTVAAPIGCYLHTNRNKCVMSALQTNATHVFFIDSDMEFPANTLIKLLGRDKDIVGAVYNRKSIPITPMFNIEKAKLPDYPFKINAVPTGLLLIKTEVFKKIPPPWFAFKFVDNSLDWMGEDVYFCGKAAEYGFEVWCDPTIEVQHIGDYAY